jgi:hypothetical protein
MIARQVRLAYRIRPIDPPRSFTEETVEAVSQWGNCFFIIIDDMQLRFQFLDLSTYFNLPPD